MSPFCYNHFDIGALLMHVGIMYKILHIPVFCYAI
jgi:hypothetical protein